MEAFLGETLDLTRHEHTYLHHQPALEPPAEVPDPDDDEPTPPPPRPGGWGWLVLTVVVGAIALWARPSGSHVLPALERHGELNMWQPFLFLTSVAPAGSTPEDPTGSPAPVMPDHMHMLLLQSRAAVTGLCQQGRVAVSWSWHGVLGMSPVLVQLVSWARRLVLHAGDASLAGYSAVCGASCKFDSGALAAVVVDLDVPVYLWSTLALAGYVAACFARRVFRHWLGEGPPDLVYNRRSARLNRLLERLPTLRKGYFPPPLLPTGVLQSAMAEAYQPKPEDTAFVREVLDLGALDFASTPGRRRLKRKCCPAWVPAGVVTFDWLGHTPSPAEIQQSRAAEADLASYIDATVGAAVHGTEATAGITPGADTTVYFELDRRQHEREPAQQVDPELMAMLDDSLADFSTTTSTSAGKTTRLREAHRQTPLRAGGGVGRGYFPEGPPSSAVGGTCRRRQPTASNSDSSGIPRYRCSSALPPVPQCWPWWRTGAPTVCVLVPGLTGDSNAGYIRRTALALRRAGVVVAVYNPRGRGGNTLQTPFLYSAGYTEDLRRAMDRVYRRFPTSPVCLMGFSLGANVVAKYVGEEGTGCRLAGAIALAAPIDCVSMSNWLLSGFLGKLMDPVLVGCVQRVRAEIEPVLKDHSGIDIAKVKTARTMSEFDDAAIAPMMGCPTASAYYREASSGNTLGDIAVPMLFLSALNDPIVPGWLVRRDDFAGGAARPGAEAPPGSLILAVTNEGGHSMVYPEGWLAQGTWTGKVVAEFVLAVAKGI